ncbi:hypothetical protein PG994_011372 [Apiospora phragmitis]|uniref:Ankyrin n=1 Tax=Apiospora phragmitis TaxID=2905665 RepID=A0ABR1TSX8_9PEZI
MNSQTREPYHTGGRDKTRPFTLDEIPSLFLATSGEEVHDAIFDDGGNAYEIFMGYNALQWHCDAPSTSPSLIWALIEFGIDIDALDQHKLPPNSAAEYPPIARRTALGYACCNGNVKAVRTLLMLGANPIGSSGSLELPFGSLQIGDQGNPTAHPTYPSPLQDLLSQRIGGPTGVCPFSVHLEHINAAADDNEDDVDVSYHQILHGRRQRYGSDIPQRECKHCSFGFNVHVAERLDAAERLSQTARAQGIYAEQVKLASMRILKCGKLLLEYINHTQLSQGHDANLPSPMDCLLRSVWHFLGPTMLCWRDHFAQSFYGLDTATLSRKELVHFAAQDPSVIPLDLQPWASLVLHASVASWPGPESEVGESAVPGNIAEKKGVDRLLAMLEDHLSLDQFPEGQFADVTFGMLPGGLPKPSQQPNDTTANEKKVGNSDDGDDGNVGSDIVTVYDDNGDLVVLPRDLVEEYHHG